VDIENITATDYLAAKAMSKTSGTEQVAFRELRKQLQAFPKAQERLLMQLLSMTRHTLEMGGSPRGSLADALQFVAALSEEKVADYVVEIEKIISHSSRLMEKAIPGNGDYTAFELTLAVSLTELQKRNPDRFKAVWENLGYRKSQRSKLLDKVASRA
jgi:hypothetical protein